ncbi:MAG: hypothetical protein WBC44_03430 [Planctomycetaceae bacterium]
MATKVEQAALKDSVKQALLELLRERPDEVRDLFEEIIEDIGMLHAIQEGLETETVPWEEIEATLRGDA